MDNFFAWLQSHAGFFQKTGAVWIALGVGSLVVTLITLPLVILQLPTDYFASDRRHRLTESTSHPAIAMLVLALKNLLGLTFLMLGAIMLFIPGQGILTMLVGLLLMNFPGKYRLEQKLVGRPAVLRTLNRIRAKWNRPPLQAP